MIFFKKRNKKKLITSKDKVDLRTLKVAFFRAVKYIEDDEWHHGNYLF
jgi:hypothetical protein